MRNAFLSFVLFTTALGCSNDGFKGEEAGSDAMMEVGILEGGSSDAPVDNYVPPPIHRLFVANQNTNNGALKPLVGWNDVDKIAGDRAPDIEIVGGMTTSSMLAIAKTRLYAWDPISKVLTGFDGAGTLASGATIAVTLGANTFVGGGTPDIQSMVYVPAGDLLLLASVGQSASAIQAYGSASTIANGTMAKARFGSNNEPFFSVVVDGQDRLFAGEFVQQNIRYVPGASGKTGAQNFSMDFGSPQMIIQAMVVDGTRLYAGGSNIGNGQASVFIYNLSNISPGKMPDVTLTPANGLGSTGLVTSLALANDTLVVGNGARVITFTGAKSLSGSSMGVALPGTMNANRVALSEKSGLLYVTGTYNGAPGVQVWKNAATMPTMQTEIRMGIGPNPTDLVLYEP